MGAVSLGGVKTFHGRFSEWQFPVQHVSNIAELEAQVSDAGEIAAVVIEPLVQGAAGIRLRWRGCWRNCGAGVMRTASS